MLTLPLLTGCSALYNYLGGNFTGPPEELEKVLRKEESRVAASLVDRAFKFNHVDKEGHYWVADYHTHIHGTGNNKGVHEFCPNIPTHPPGIWLTSKRFDPIFHPYLYLLTKVFLDASGIENWETGDLEYLQRLLSLIEHFPVRNDSHGNPVKFKFFIFAMAPFYDPNSKLRDDDKTDISVDSDYVIAVADCFNEKLDMAGVPHRASPVISVHPYRRDAIDELKRLQWKVRQHGYDEVLVKWLPPSMGIDPREVSLSYYKTMAEYGMVLITHTGKEHSAITDEKYQELSNPLYLERALESKGLKVIMSHSGRGGKGLDSNGKQKPNYELFKDMMNKHRGGNVFGDIAAIPYRKTDHILVDIASSAPELRNQMLNGSDYPVPALNIIRPTSEMQKEHYISKEQAKALDLIYGYNPLLYDFVLKRTLRFEDNTPLPERVFLPISQH